MVELLSVQRMRYYSLLLEEEDKMDYQELLYNPLLAALLLLALLIVPIDGDCPPDGGVVPPPDGGVVPPPDGGVVPPPDGGVVPASDDAADADELSFARTGKKSILGKIPIVTIDDKRMKQIIRAVAGLFIYNTSNGVIYMYPCYSLKHFQVSIYCTWVLHDSKNMVIFS
jgi:hypothetical protein